MTLNQAIDKIMKISPFPLENKYKQMYREGNLGLKAKIGIVKKAWPEAEIKITVEI